MGVGIDEVGGFVEECGGKEGEMYVGLYADEWIGYGEMVGVVNIGKENDFKMVVGSGGGDKK